ncbi:tyrosine-type recombinase/integrase [Halapricum desulfuricans]|nr:site-specific integrase [Halapricum desulfuricans]
MSLVRGRAFVDFRSPPMSTLDPITPREALEMYCNDIDGELSPNSVQAKRYQLGFFVDWCEGADNDETARVENLNEITGRDFTRFKNWRSDGINKVTLRTNLSALRTFMRFCVSIDAVDPSIPEKINVPTLDYGENERETFLSHERATTIRAYLRKFQYASLKHVLFTLQWHTGVRMSALHSLDVEDFDYEQETIRLRHRPDTDTRLKNGEAGNRLVTIDTETAAVVDDYIEHKRTPATDEYGRHPLFSSSKGGRMSKSHLNKHMYRLTVPCEYGQPCPADKDPQDCEYAGTFRDFIKCPHNVRPHDVRRGSITHWLRNDVPEKAVSDRMDVSVKTIDKHYDKRSEDERAEVRRQYLNEV